MNFLADLTPATARPLIISMTLSCQTLLAEITAAKTAKQRAAKLARFEQLNGERVRLIEEHGLQAWVATIAA
jgi:hypothetical protein